MTNSRWFTYENGLLLLLSFTFGIVFFDRNAVGVLTPFIVEELSLSNTQLGMLGSGLSLAWAISAYLIGAWSDRKGVRKPFLLVSILIFSVCSALSGLAGGFVALLLTRVVMGFAEGPFMPICLSIMNVESTPKRRGVNAGLLQNFFASLLGTSLAPILLVWLAQAYGWRSAFFLSAVPGLICAFLVWKFMREPQGEPASVTAATHARFSAMGMLRERNILVCSGISVFIVSWFLVSLIFLPLFFTAFRGLTPEDMSYVIFPMGFATMICGFLVPALSDRIGRKPVMIIFSFLGMVTPLAALYFDGPLWMLSLLLVVGWSASGSMALFMGVIPGETVPRAMAASSMGLVVGIGEIVGGVGSPTFAGWVADQSSLAGPMYVSLVCAFCAGVLSMFLKETAPSKVPQPVQVVSAI
ncbi:MAG: MFS transporter [Pseudomonadota bacterium]